MTTYTGNNGDNHINGSNGNDIIYGLGGCDDLDGKKGNDYVYGGSGNDVIHGSQGDDHLFGEADHDALFGDERQRPSDRRRRPRLPRRRPRLRHRLLFRHRSANTTSTALSACSRVVHDRRLRRRRRRPAGPRRAAGLRRRHHRHRSVNNAPIAFNDTAATNEDVGTYSSGAASVLDNDFDFEGDTLTVTPASSPALTARSTLNADGTYTYTPYASTQSLAQGQVVQDSFNYTVSDGS